MVMLKTQKSKIRPSAFFSLTKLQISLVWAEILRYKYSSFSGQTFLPPIVLTSCGYILSALRIIIRKQTRNVNIFQFLLIWINIFSILSIQELDNLSVFPSLWQATIRDLSRLIPISCKRHNMKFSRSFGATDLGMPEKFKHSLPVYCSSLWCCLSSSMSLLLVDLKASCKGFWGVLCHWNITF